MKAAYERSDIMKNYQLLQEMDRYLQNFRRSGIYKRNKTKLSDADIMVLFCVDFCDINQQIKLSDIAKTLKVTLPAVTHKVNDLLDKGMLEKVTSKKDLRVTNIKLTQAGKAYVESIRDDYYYPLEKLIEHLGEDDSFTLLRILKKVNDMGKIKF